VWVVKQTKGEKIMVEQFEVGKYYKCIDAAGFEESLGSDDAKVMKYFDKNYTMFVDGVRLISHVDTVCSQVGDYVHVVCKAERHFFEEVKRGNTK